MPAGGVAQLLPEPGGFEAPRGESDSTRPTGDFASGQSVIPGDAVSTPMPFPPAHRPSWASIGAHLVAGVEELPQASLQVVPRPCPMAQDGVLMNYPGPCDGPLLGAVVGSDDITRRQSAWGDGSGHTYTSGQANGSTDDLDVLLVIARQYLAAGRRCFPCKAGFPGQAASVERAGLRPSRPEWASRGDSPSKISTVTVEPRIGKRQTSPSGRPAEIARRMAPSWCASSAIERSKGHQQPGPGTSSRSGPRRVGEIENDPRADGGGPGQGRS